MLPPLNWNRTQSDSWSVKTRCTNVAKWKWVLWSTPSSWLYLGQKLLTVDRSPCSELARSSNKVPSQENAKLYAGFFFSVSVESLTLYLIWLLNCSLCADDTPRLEALLFKKSHCSCSEGIHCYHSPFVHVTVVWRLQIFWKRKLN